MALIQHFVRNSRHLLLHNLHTFELLVEQALQFGEVVKLAGRAHLHGGTLEGLSDDLGTVRKFAQTLTGLLLEHHSVFWLQTLYWGAKVKSPIVEIRLQQLDLGPALRLQL